MNIFERALISIRRQYGKTIILVLLIFILGMLITSVIMVKNAIDQTKINLWSSMPAIASISFDFDTAQNHYNEGDFLVWETGLNPSEIRQIGQLPYVSNFDYSYIHTFWSDELSSYGNFSVPGIAGFSGEETTGFHLKGVYYPCILDIEEEIIELISGQTFSEIEIASTIFPALISQELATLNHLTVGSAFVLDSRIYDLEEVFRTNEWTNPEHILQIEHFELKVVGIFKVLQDANIGSINESDFNERAINQLKNQIYVPMDLIELAPSFDFHISSLPEQGGSGLTSYFILYDSLMMPDFVEASNLLLSGAWRIVNLSGNFSSMITSMETMQRIATLVFWGGIKAMFVVLGLIITLSLHDRKYEIGIYLALGERKERVICQVLIEMLTVTMFVLGLSIWAGNVIVSYFSQIMLEQNLVRQLEIETPLFFVNQSLMWLNPGEMSIDEMMANYDINLDGRSFIIIFSIGILIVLSATIISLSYVYRARPKKILM